VPFRNDVFLSSFSACRAPRERQAKRKTKEIAVNKSNCKAELEAAEKDIDLAKKSYTVELTTNKGPIRLQFLPDLAPGHVKNFIACAKIGFFDGLTFHRVIEGFMIQGGCPLGTGTGNSGRNIKAEFNSTPHVAGVLSMARSDSPNSASTQFFICHEEATFLDNKYTAFGKVTDQESQDTVNKIATVKTRNDKPIEAVTITKVTVKEAAK
jgi:cyclophilin family peptidyl-prolyl cis-trans isomerase